MRSLFLFLGRNYEMMKSVNVRGAIYAVNRNFRNFESFLPEISLLTSLRCRVDRIFSPQAKPKLRKQNGAYQAATATG